MCEMIFNMWVTSLLIRHELKLLHFSFTRVSTKIYVADDSKRDQLREPGKHDKTKVNQFNPIRSRRIMSTILYSYRLR